MIGEMTERVTFRAKTRTSDGDDGFEHSWADHATVWAKVMPLDPEPGFAAERQRTRYAITIRNRADLTTEMEILWRGRRLAVEDVPWAGPRAEMLTVRAVATW